MTTLTRTPPTFIHTHGVPCDLHSDLAAESSAVNVENLLDSHSGHAGALLSETLGLDHRHAARWTAVCVVLQDCQAWRDDQPAPDRLVNNAEFHDLLV